MKLLAPGKSIRIKNHITHKSRALNSQLSAKFGITLSDFEKACLGDLATIQKIGELSRQAGFMKEYAPKLKDAYLQIIEGSTTYNLALADILKAAGSASLQIDKAANSTALADRKYVHGKVELSQQYLLDKKAENERHTYQLNYSQIRGYMNAFLVDIDRNTAILEQENRPEIQQIAADKTYQDKLINEYLDNGDNARPDLIPQKNYTGIKSKFKQFMSSLGF
ncbi:MAG: hypothetical protein ACKPHV_20200 [Microcystis panniformis]